MLWKASTINVTLIIRGHLHITLYTSFVLTNTWGSWYIHSRTKLCTPFTACVLLCYECFVILWMFTLFNRHVAVVFTYRNVSSNSTKLWDTESFDQAIFQDFPNHFCRIRDCKIRHGHMAYIGIGLFIKTQIFGFFHLLVKSYKFNTSYTFNSL